MKIYDAIVIGAGQAGTPLAKKLAKAGMKTALVEERWIGGTCINDGCTPTKTMIASARAAYLARTSQQLGVHAKEVTIDIDTIIDRKDEIVERFRNGSQKGLEETDGVTIIFGTAMFHDKNKISVTLSDGTSQIISAEKIFINTGTHPAIPDIPGLKEAGYLTATTIMDRKEIPGHLLIIGAGYIGMEFGQMYRRFGSRVTMLENGGRLLPKEDNDIAEEIANILKDEGIEVLMNASVKSVKKLGVKLDVVIDIDGAEKNIECSHLLVAAGRRPNTDRLNVAAAGIDMDERGYIKVNDRLETSMPGIYALGDVNGGPQFTHISYHDYIIVTKNILGNGHESTATRLVPYCMFTDPQLARVGMTEQEAIKRGMKVRTAKLQMTSVARAIETGDTRGMMKAVVDAETDMILGAAIIGTEAGEITTVLQMAMMGGIDHRTIRNTAIAHPTFSESLNNLFMRLDE